MPGLIPHLIAGTALYFIGIYYFRTYFKKNNKNKLLLALICIIFSLIPDIFLGIFYTTHLFSFETLIPYHILTHIIIIPTAIITFIVLIFILDTKRKPIYTIGIVAIILHIVMDLIIQETNLFI